MSRPSPATGAGPQPQAPSWLRLLAEVRAIGELFRYCVVRDRLPAEPAGHGTVFVLPGLAAGDLLTRPLRRYLERLGYDVHGWGLGLNRGFRPEQFDLLQRRIREAAAATGKVALIGWSLGGLYARELAKREPDAVRLVISMGSPFVGPPRANNAWRLYERVAGHSVDLPAVEFRLDEPPPVPTIAIYSPRDGIVPPDAARNPDGRGNVAVDSSHIGLVWNPRVLTRVAECLATAPASGPEPGGLADRHGARA